MPLLFPFILGLAGAVVSLVFASNRRAQVAEAWSHVAAKLGLKYSAGSGLSSFGTIHGLFRGVSVNVSVKIRGSGDSRKEYTSCRLDFPSGASGNFRMSKQSTFSFFASLFGNRDVQIGDPAFDSRVVIDADDPVAVDRYLTPARRMAIVQLMEAYAYVEVTATSLTAEIRNASKDPVTLEAWIRYLIDVAFVLGSPSPVDVALEKQQRGDLADAVVTLHEINDAQDADPNSFTQFLEAEALIAMGEGDNAAQILDDLPVFDAELGEWKTVAKSHPKPVELRPISPANLSDLSSDSTTTAGEIDEGQTRKPAPKPASSARPNAAVSLDQTSIIDDLFGSDRPGYEVEKRFFDVYESKIVEWTGTVRRSREFRSDRDFPGAGVKATVEIGSRGDSKLVSNQINAIVHLPEGTTLQSGDIVSFRGTFVRTDRYMRNLFVSNAELL